MYPVARWRSIYLVQCIACLLAMTGAMSGQSSQTGAGTLVFVPATGSVAMGGTLQLTAYRAFSPTAKKNAVAINSDIRWRCSDTSIAIINSAGVVTPLKQ